MGMEEIKDMDMNSWLSQLAYEQWVAVPVSGSRPLARYKHAATIVEEKLYVMGGSRNGRYLSDVQVFDIRSFTWSALKLKTGDHADNSENSSSHALSATSDHSMVRWGNKLLIFGGHSKKSPDAMIVQFIDLETLYCGVIETSGKAPVARGGHSATLVGSQLIIFGGEDNKRRLLNDVYSLNLQTMTWDIVKTSKAPPAPRFDHTAALHADRYLYIFGGCSHSIFFNDLHVLDLQTMEWSEPEIQGNLVTPRAGHSGVAVDENWYIVGGGDNKNGCPETLVLNRSKLAWSTVASVKGRDPLASEGLSVCSTSIDGEKHLLAFGGYNGKYNNEVFILRLKPRDPLRPKILGSPAAAAAAASVTAAYALAKSEKLDFSYLAKEADNKHPERDVAMEIDAVKEEKKTLELSLAEVRLENSRLREKIAEVNGTHAELSKELQSVQGQLIAERSRCFNLEAQIAELQKMLESLDAIKNEVQLLRRQKSVLDQELEKNSAAQRQGSGGVWKWIAG